MFWNLLALKLEYAMSVYQKFRDCKTAGPFLCPRMIFARVGLTSSQGVGNLLFTLCAPDVSFQRGFLIYVKIRVDLQTKKFHFPGLQFIQITLVKKKKKKIEHLELVPSSICPFLVLPSIGRYSIEYLALYEVLATKDLFHTHNWLSNGLPKWPKP